MTSPSQQWLNLVTSEFNQQPNFMAMLAGLMDPLAELQITLASIPALYDIDIAVGVQLDAVGEWVGASRNIPVPLTGVFFSWNTAGLGWDEGNWYNPATPDQIDVLDDTDYRTLLRAKIAANQWDGTTPGAYDIWNLLFEGTGIGILIQDYNDMSFTYVLTGPVTSAVFLALFTGGYLNLKPAGVRIRAYVTPSIPGAPYFAWAVPGVGYTGPNLAGWGTGQWGIYNPGA